jgi:hypothetical protein
VRFPTLWLDGYAAPTAYRPVGVDIGHALKVHRPADSTSRPKHSAGLQDRPRPPTRSACPATRPASLWAGLPPSLSATPSPFPTIKARERGGLAGKTVKGEDDERGSERREPGDGADGEHERDRSHRSEGGPASELLHAVAV